MVKNGKHGLGRGLDALMGDPVPESMAPEPEQGEDRVVQVRITDIDPNRDQPRRHFDEAGLPGIVPIHSGGRCDPAGHFAPGGGQVSADRRRAGAFGRPEWRGWTACPPWCGIGTR